MNNSNLRARSVTNYDKIIGKKIHDYRQSKSISQIEVSKKLRISQQQYAKYENGVNRISVGRLWELSEFYGWTGDVLLDILSPV